MAEELTAERIEFYETMKIDAAVAVHYWWFEEFKDSTPLDELTMNGMHEGWLRLLEIEASGHFYCCNSSEPVVKICDANLTAGNGMEDYDACVADAVVQCALLQEIRYG